MEKKITPQHLQRATFDLFIKLRPGIPSHFPGQKRTWCYRGDKFYSDIKFQFRSILTLVKNKIDLYDIIEMYDNRYKKSEESRLILKIEVAADGTIDIKKTLLHRYSHFIVDYPVPDWLQKK